MEKDMNELENENEKLRKTLSDIKLHIDEINRIMDSISDLIADKEQEKYTDDDVRNLLKKYSRL